MDENPTKRQVTDELKNALKHTAERVIHDRKEWDTVVASERPERSALLKELTAFADLCEYFEREQIPLPHDIIDDLTGIENLQIDQRTDQFREINQRLLARVPNADSGNKSRM